MNRVTDIKTYIERDRDRIKRGCGRTKSDAERKNWVEKRR